MSCSVTLATMLDINARSVKVDGDDKSSFYELLAQLGSIGFMDRLTILQKRPNQKKGRLFGGKQTNEMSKYKLMSSQVQLQETKETGLVFEYVNNIAVWQKFCATYEGVYSLLGYFDTWYSQNGQGVTIPNLQNEWKAYTQTVLSSMVLRSRAAYEAQRAQALSKLSSSNAADAVFLRHWAVNDLVNKARIRITGSCDHLDKTTV